jgi:hypothetical protein
MIILHRENSRERERERESALLGRLVKNMLTHQLRIGGWVRQTSLPHLE